ncbi:NifB/NifX family molybdenum-iron cluster-binding protein [Halosquirtibacter laminarini]|uniref:NifB/NifX family molybdenum-iron cluster-binding protein n=1 Tax=Halosquirtibacter laminarini TaxID=3374600 RepID=A0AC61NJI9_9BACT|nr:NifB/NifX family molybdenum-iron cluster-binding protein [Prolixibacteraceae bacterium]
MRKKIALPIDEQGVLFVHFGHAPFFCFYEVENGIVVNKEKIVAPEHKPGYLPVWMGSHDVNVVITSGLGAKAKTLFNDKGIEVVTGVEVASAEEIIGLYLNENLIANGNGCTHKAGHTCDH